MNDLRLVPSILADPELGPGRIAKSWYDLASRQDPWYDAFSLATATTDGEVSCRVVRGEILEGGTARFGSSIRSRKSRQLGENTRAALLAFWQRSERQLRMEGQITIDDETTADSIFSRRPRDLQLLAWVTTDGEPQTPAEYSAEFKRIDRNFRNREIPRPAYWRIYLLVPTRYEFWEANENRHHVCVRYDKSHNDDWKHAFVGP